MIEIITKEAKAKELVNTFGKNYALLIIDEILEVLQHNHEPNFDEYATDEYWEEVRKVINKL